MQSIDFHIIEQSLYGLGDECGDLGLVKLYDNRCLIALIDGLGHGKSAHDAALLARTYLLEHYGESPNNLITGLHNHLEGSRGAVSVVCKLCLETGQMRYSGMGNITLRIYGNTTRRLATREGILGYMITPPKEDQVTLYPGDIVVITSDGIREHFDLLEFPDILLGNSQTIARRFIDNLSKGNDDASCIVLRYGV